MTTDKLAERLLEADNSNESTKIDVLVTRMLLKIASVPAFLSSLCDYSLKSESVNGKTEACIQFDFVKMPKEAMPQLSKLLSLDFFEDSKMFQFIKNGQAHVGIQINVSEDDLPGEEIDYVL